MSNFLPANLQPPITPHCGQRSSSGASSSSGGSSSLATVPICSGSRNELWAVADCPDGRDSGDGGGGIGDRIRVVVHYELCNITYILVMVHYLFFSYLLCLY